MLHFLLAWTSVVTSGPLHSIHDWQRAKSSIFGSHTYSSLASNALGGRQFSFPVSLIIVTITQVAFFSPLFSQSSFCKWLFQWTVEYVFKTLCTSDIPCHCGRSVTSTLGC
uniref:Uncharacterized protein n=1 Tax=Rhipicephalus microplus TaxID=6941 RepID=A0A6G5A240_RHIMP